MRISSQERNIDFQTLFAKNYQVIGRERMQMFLYSFPIGFLTRGCFRNAFL